jgi:hypothetical protein
MASSKTLIERSRLKPWRGGPVRDWTTSPRLFTGRPKDASRPIAESLMQFLKRYEIPLNAFSRHTRISGWAIRQAKDGKRSLPVIAETLIKATMERIGAGKLWLRRVTKRRQDLVWIQPPYKPLCPRGALYCYGVLPASCPRRFNECILSSNDWEAIEKFFTPGEKEKTES